MAPNSDSPAGASSDTPPELITARLRLRPNHRAYDRALRAGAAEFEKRYGLTVAEGLTDFVQPEERDSVAEAFARLPPTA